LLVLSPTGVRKNRKSIGIVRFPPNGRVKGGV
jgi:hypothetical protein